jgi:hypothetical protein
MKKRPAVAQPKPLQPTSDNMDLIKRMFTSWPACIATYAGLAMAIAIIWLGFNS